MAYFGKNMVYYGIQLILCLCKVQEKQVFFSDARRKLHYIIHVAYRRTSHKKGSTQVNKLQA